jgi:hypothetical protein
MIGHAGMIISYPLLMFLAVLFRMPMSIRRQIEGIRMKNMNKAFIEIDRQMQWYYSFGYFIAISMMMLSTLLVLFFNYIYPSWYVTEYLFTLLWMFIFDVTMYPTGWGMMQLLHALLAK